MILMLNNTTTATVVCKTCECPVPGPRHFCEPCFRAMLARSDEARRSAPPAPTTTWATRAEAEAANPGKKIKAAWVQWHPVRFVVEAA